MELLKYINNIRKQKRSIHEVINKNINIITPTKEEFIAVQSVIKNFNDNNNYYDCPSHMWNLYKEHSAISIYICELFTEILPVDYIKDNISEDKLINIDCIIWE
jgi:hypothetical protein